MKKYCIFAVQKPLKGQVKLSTKLGIFYVHTVNISIRQFAPCVHCNGVHRPSLEEVFATGNGLPFFIQPCNILNSFNMQKTNESSLKGYTVPIPNTDSPDTVTLLIRELIRLKESSNITINIHICNIAGNGNVTNTGYMCGDISINQNK